MPIHIYFGDKPLILQEKRTLESNTHFDPNKVSMIDSLEEERIQWLINKMQQKDTEAAVVLFDQEKALEAISRYFVVIQAAGGFVFDGNKQVLLIFRRGKWDLPKGKLDEDENLETCAVREVEEETGLQHITIQKKLCITYHTYFQDGEHILKESHWYLMQTNSNQVLTPQVDEDIDQCKWVKFEEIAPYMENTHPSIRDVVTKGIEILNAAKKV